MAETGQTVATLFFSLMTLFGQCKPVENACHHEIGVQLRTCVSIPTPLVPSVSEPAMVNRGCVVIGRHFSWVNPLHGRNSLLS